jgi:hypothetical protein
MVEWPREAVGEDSRQRLEPPALRESLRQPAVVVAESEQLRER